MRYYSILAIVALVATYVGPAIALPEGSGGSGSDQPSPVEGLVILDSRKPDDIEKHYISAAQNPTSRPLRGSLDIEHLIELPKSGKESGGISRMFNFWLRLRTM